MISDQGCFYDFQNNTLFYELPSPPKADCHTPGALSIVALHLLFYPVCKKRVASTLDCVARQQYNPGRRISIMADPPQNQEQWQRSSIGITPVTVRPRPGTRRIKKQDVVGTEIITTKAHPHALRGAGAAGGSRESGTEGTGRVCSVCTRASADYSCPRCLIGYCSSNCYKVRCSSIVYMVPTSVVLLYRASMIAASECGTPQYSSVSSGIIYSNGGAETDDRKPCACRFWTFITGGAARPAVDGTIFRVHLLYCTEAIKGLSGKYL